MQLRTADYFIDYGRENDQPQDDPDGHLRLDIAKVCEAAAKIGGHPADGARSMERALLAYAGPG
jgi:hypothetical protein